MLFLMHDAHRNLRSCKAETNYMPSKHLAWIHQISLHHGWWHTALISSILNINFHFGILITHHKWKILGSDEIFFITKCFQILYTMVTRWEVMILWCISVYFRSFSKNSHIVQRSVLIWHDIFWHVGPFGVGLSEMACQCPANWWSRLQIVAVPENWVYILNKARISILSPVKTFGLNIEMRTLFKI